MLAVTPEQTLQPILPANHIPGPRQGEWTYKEYAALPDDGRRYEIMDGVLLMPPSPSPEHQSIVKRFAFYFAQHVDLAGIGQMFFAPLDVELAPKQIVQPDLLVLLNENLHKITARHVLGGPDLVVEVVSPATVVYDRITKIRSYEQAGVQEYWLVYPETKTIEVMHLKAGGYQSIGIFQGEDTITSQVVPGISTVHVEQFFHW